jgi:hypothetical protein
MLEDLSQKTILSLLPKFSSACGQVYPLRYNLSVQFYSCIHIFLSVFKANWLSVKIMFVPVLTY